MYVLTPTQYNEVVVIDTVQRLGDNRQIYATYVI